MSIRYRYNLIYILNSISVLICVIVNIYWPIKIFAVKKLVPFFSTSPILLKVSLQVTLVTY